MNILDHISDSLETIVWVKILEFFDADPELGSGDLFDSGSGMEKVGIRDKHPGSATLPVCIVFFFFFYCRSFAELFIFFVFLFFCFAF
jgi:hypothetical protein